MEQPQAPKRFKVLACKVLYREISLLTATSPHIVDVTYLQQGLHDTPKLLLQVLQNQIDMIDEHKDICSFKPDDGEDFDAILLGYGLCSNAICGLHSKHYKIVVPRTHDCIALFLGSQDAYQKYFDEHNGGVYWYTPGFIENSSMPGGQRVEAIRAKYVAKYGEENADYLMEAEQGWLKDYTQCAYVAWDGLPSDANIAFTKDSATYLDWKCDVLQGDSTLMNNFLNGHWPEAEFLVVPPGHTLVASFDETILTSEPTETL